MFVPGLLLHAADSMMFMQVSAQQIDLLNIKMSHFMIANQLNELLAAEEPAADARKVKTQPVLTRGRL